VDPALVLAAAHDTAPREHAARLGHHRALALAAGIGVEYTTTQSRVVPSS
jgi:hypothetical protein